MEFDEEALKQTYGKFVASPLERGFGTTLGNALRRILLSSLQGAAVTSVKFEGVLHEFSTLPGVMEDVTDMMVVAETLADHTNKLETKFTERTSELENQIKKLEKEINGFKKKTRK